MKCRHVATLNLRMTYGITGLSRDDKVNNLSTLEVDLALTNTCR